MWILFQLTRNGWFYWSLNRLGKAAFHPAKWGQLRKKKKSEVCNLGWVESKTISLTLWTQRNGSKVTCLKADRPVMWKKNQNIEFSFNWKRGPFGFDSKVWHSHYSNLDSP